MSAIYISGPITGWKNLNIDSFNEARKKLEDDGWVNIVSPHDICKDLRESGIATHNDYMRECIKALCECDAIHMLQGWQTSIGARAEEYVARTIGLTFID